MDCKLQQEHSYRLGNVKFKDNSGAYGSVGRTVQTGDRRVATLKLTRVTVFCYCVLSSNKTLYPLHSTGSTQKDRNSSQYD